MIMGLFKNLANTPVVNDNIIICYHFSSLNFTFERGVREEIKKVNKESITNMSKERYYQIVTRSRKTRSYWKKVIQE